MHEYELWAEANSAIFWTGGPNPAEYVAALRAVRDALHRVDPSARLLASLGWQDFVEGSPGGVYAAGRPGLIDGVGFHPYAPGDHRARSGGRQNTLRALRRRRPCRARQAAAVVICGAGETPKASLLPLDRQIDHTSPTCVKGRTTYDGNPIEAALMNLSTADGRAAPGYVNAFGESVACIPDGPPVWEFEVISEVKNIAASQRYRCTVPREYGTAPPGLCRVVEEPLPLAGAPTATAAVAKRAATCRWQASAKVLAARPKRATLKAGVGCRVTPKQSRFTLSVQSGKTSKRVRTLTLRPA